MSEHSTILDLGIDESVPVNLESYKLSPFLTAAGDVLPDVDKNSFLKLAGILPTTSLDEIMGGWDPEAIWALINHGTGFGWFVVVSVCMRVILKIGGPRDWEVPTRFMISTNAIFSLSLGILAGALRAGSLDPSGLFNALNTLMSL